jgi:hypothetical protein
MRPGRPIARSPGLLHQPARSSMQGAAPSPRPMGPVAAGDRATTSRASTTCVLDGVLIIAHAPSLEQPMVSRQRGRLRRLDPCAAQAWVPLSRQARRPDGFRHAWRASSPSTQHRPACARLSHLGADWAIAVAICRMVSLPDSLLRAQQARPCRSRRSGAEAAIRRRRKSPLRRKPARPNAVPSDRAWTEAAGRTFRGTNALCRRAGRPAGRPAPGTSA